MASVAFVQSDIQVREQVSQGQSVPRATGVKGSAQGPEGELTLPAMGFKL